MHQGAYDNITVFDQGAQIPADHSAANDLNKIVRAEYEDPFYTDLAIIRFHICTSQRFANKRYRKPLMPGKHPSSPRISIKPGFCIAYPGTHPDKAIQSPDTKEIRDCCYQPSCSGPTCGAIEWKRGYLSLVLASRWPFAGMEGVHQQV